MRDRETEAETEWSGLEGYGVGWTDMDVYATVWMGMEWVGETETETEKDTDRQRQTNRLFLACSSFGPLAMRLLL